jgi:hypothetical protein
MAHKILINVIIDGIAHEAGKVVDGIDPTTAKSLVERGIAEETNEQPTVETPPELPVEIASPPQQDETPQTPEQPTDTGAGEADAPLADGGESQGTQPDESNSTDSPDSQSAPTEVPPQPTAEQIAQDVASVETPSNESDIHIN